MQASKNTAPTKKSPAKTILFIASAIIGLLAFATQPSWLPDASTFADSDLQFGDQIAGPVYICAIDATAKQRKVPAGLLGTNLEWFNNANSIADNSGRIAPAWAKLAKEQGVENIRFPGGTLSDFYHWEDGIGPVASRPVRDHPTDTGKSPNVVGTREFIEFCRAVGARPLITVNAGTANAREAAAWVAYCNDPINSLRARDGHPEPFNVKLWEVGNELYLPGNPGDKKIITVKPEVYAARFLEFAKAMKAVDPSIQLMGIGTANPYAVQLPYPDWTEKVLSTAASEMDYYAVHNAYFPMIFGANEKSVEKVYKSLWAAPEAVKRSLVDLDATMSKHDKERRIEVAITEWGAMFSFDKQWIDHVKTQGSAVYLARLMQVFLEQPRVTIANYFKFTDRTFMGWVAYDKSPKIPYYVIQLIANHFGDYLVSSSIESPTFSVPALGPMKAETNVPELTVVSSISADGKTLFANIVSRSWTTPRKVTFEFNGFEAKPDAVAWVVSAAKVVSHNGHDIPADVAPKSMYDEPSPLGEAPVKIERVAIETGKPILVEPHSFLTIEFSANN